ncbi:MAG: hypothetical protein QP733_04650 [Dialister micraerophilus]|uniref:hypothetical protein n=1 Tax=Dialister micraerophilus TaxID=309120 RepID=UPI002550CF83|nr:hypothetical protein [Dialister micraerophilus]MDK8253721.1 hypothetical protein [Dialister micraerophilus]
MAAEQNSTNSRKNKPLILGYENGNRCSKLSKKTLFSLQEIKSNTRAAANFYNSQQQAGGLKKFLKRKYITARTLNSR